MNDETSKEARILQAVKFTLTGVIRDTATTPGVKHPLSDKTIENLRDCLVLITEREKELKEAAGDTSAARPYYVDEPPKPRPVEVSLAALRTKPGDREDH